MNRSRAVKNDEYVSVSAEAPTMVKFNRPPNVASYMFSLPTQPHLALNQYEFQFGFKYKVSLRTTCPKYFHMYSTVKQCCVSILPCMKVGVIATDDIKKVRQDPLNVGELATFLPAECGQTQKGRCTEHLLTLIVDLTSQKCTLASASNTNAKSKEIAMGSAWRLIIKGQPKTTAELLDIERLK